MKNQPYIKKFDNNGELLNPIVGKYESKTFLGTQKITDDFNQVRYVPIYLPNRNERRNKSFIKNEMVNKLRTNYLNNLKKTNKYLEPLEDFKYNLANLFPNLRKLIQNTKSTLENYKKAFFNSALYLRNG